MRELRRLAMRSDDRLEFSSGDVSDLERSFTVYRVSRDGNALDANNFVDKSGNAREGTPELACVGLEQGVLLGLRRVVINVESHAPVSLNSDAWNVRDGSDGAPANVDAIDVAFLDSPRNETIACPAIRCATNPARTDAVAGANLDNLTLDPVPHLILLRVCFIERCSASPLRMARQARRRSWLRGGYLCLTIGGLQNAGHSSEWRHCKTKSWIPPGFCLEMGLIFSAGEVGTRRRLGTVLRRFGCA